MAKIEEQINAAEQRLKQLKALKQKRDARTRMTEAKKRRADDTRRKILMGAFALEVLERAGVSPDLYEIGGERFKDWLTRSDDRALFGLAPEVIGGEPPVS